MSRQALTSTETPRRKRHGFVADDSGGKLPPIPMSKALRAALEAEAENNLRHRKIQVLVILEWYYGLNDMHPNQCGQARQMLQAALEAKTSKREKKQPLKKQGNVIYFPVKGGDK